MNDRSKIVHDIFNAVCAQLGGFEVPHGYMKSHRTTASVIAVLDQHKLLPVVKSDGVTADS